MGQKQFDLVNLDFELSLNGVHQKNANNIIAEFEYIYFFINRDESRSLVAHRNYSKIYLDYLNAKGIKTSFVYEKETANNWWGSLENIDIAKKLNSKVFAYNYTLQFQNYPEAQIVKNLSEINISAGKYILKNDTGVSGNGNYIFSLPGEIKEDAIVKKIGNGPYLVQPFLERVTDFGITLDLENETYFANENFMGQFGRFGGGRVLSNEKLKELLDSFEGDFDFIKMIKEFKKMGARGTLQFDNFTYRCSDTGELKLYFMCEINYRKTMGLVIKELSNRNQFGEWHIFPKGLKEKEHRVLLERYWHNDNILVTSPENSRFLSIHFSAATQGEVDLEINELKKFLSIESLI